MRIIFFAAAVATASAAPAYAQDTAAPASAAAQSHFYGQINLGASVAGNADLDASVETLGSASDDIDLDAGFFGGGLVGLATESGFHGQVEALYHESKGDTEEYEDFVGGVFDASVRTYGALLNGLYQAETPYGFSPYAGAGVGVGSVEYDVEGDGDSESGLMWQIKAGAVFPMGKRFEWDLGYRYLRAPEYEVSETIVSGGETLDVELAVDTSAHILSVGGRFAF